MLRTDRRRDQLAGVPGDGHVPDPAPAHRYHIVASGWLPAVHSQNIITAGQQRRAVLLKPNTPNGRTVLLRGADRLERLQVPEFDHPVLAGRGQQQIARMERQGVDGGLVRRVDQLLEQFSRLPMVNLHAAPDAGGGDPFAVGRKEHVSYRVMALF